MSSTTPQGSGASASSGPGGNGPSGQVLEELIRELNGAILALRTLIEREYPNRREIEARFVNKSSWDTRLKILVVTIFLATLLSFGATIGAMSACYLGTTHPMSCNLIPGYEDSEARRQERLEQIAKIQDLEDRIEELEQR